jgi:tryptophanyl-tRNA synthetase
MTQFKDKAGEDQEAVSVGLFDYPVLMAADILLYQADKVPVGQDQKQHIELARNLAERFNNKFGQTFTLPEPYIPAAAARIMGLDNPEKKMSKSLGPDNYLGLLDDAPTIREKMKKAVTDSDNQVRFDQEEKPAISNLLTIFAAIADQSVTDLEKQYQSSGYGQFKNDLADALIAFLTPVQEKYQQISADRSQLEQLLQKGSAKAEAVAEQTLQSVKQKMGVL